MAIGLYMHPSRSVETRLGGFELLFAWHLLIIFCPLIACIADPFSGFLWERQCLIAVSTGLGFLLFQAFGSRFHYKILSRNTVCMALFLTIASVGGLATFFGLTAASWPHMAVSTIIMGLTEGFLMMFWLANYSMVNGLDANSQTARKAVVATFICFYFCNVGRTLAAISASALPFAAALIYVLSIRRFDEDNLEEEVGESAFRVDRAKNQEADRFKGHRRISFAATLVFAFSFGLLQSVHVELDNVLVGATDTYGILGATIAYGFTHFFLEKKGDPTALIAIYIIAFFVFFIASFGSLLSIAVAGVFLIMGFHLFDFAALGIAINLADGLIRNPYKEISANRAAVYFGYGASFAAGHLAVSLSGPVTSPLEMPLLFASISTIVLIVVLIAFLVIRFADKGKDEQSDLAEAATSKISAQVSAEERLGLAGVCLDDALVAEKAEACLVLSKRFRLTQREREILDYLSDGKEALFISQQLWISMSTVRTHMANLYRKIGVHNATELQEAIEETRKERQHESNGSSHD